ncbi:unnamed protein product [Amoebophrya sp. A25]|nr:unnamed protein product [Amoebophrya sp. A25]|eukprot:GSA25T00013738001.1
MQGRVLLAVHAFFGFYELPLRGLDRFRRGTPQTAPATRVVVGSPVPGADDALSSALTRVEVIAIEEPQQIVF